MNTLLNLSGGLDSAYCLYQAMQAGEHLLVHHIRLKNHEGRQQLEHQAVRRIRAWIDQQNLPGAYTYIESGYESGTIGWIPQDVAIWAFQTGVIMSGPRYAHIDSLIVPRHQDAFVHMKDPAAGMAASDRFIQSFVSLLAKREVKILTPIGHLRKAEIIAAMPAELRRRCWWCRTPKRNAPCHKCATCKSVDAALAVS
jgi:7-cyano-7-deazaguanine synthase in queuosine biosynthesis